MEPVAARDPWQQDSADWFALLTFEEGDP